MPQLATPRSFDFLILKSPGSTAPMVATGTLIPAAMFGGATYDLYGLFCANVYRGYMHMVAIGVIDAGEHMTHNNAVKHIARALHAFNARTGKV